jgi:hypothetical protein
MGPWLRKVNDRVGPEIAHLSYKRNAIPEDARNWHFVDIRGELVAVLRELLPRMQDRHLSTSFRQRIERALPAAPVRDVRSDAAVPGQQIHIYVSDQLAGTATHPLPPPRR